MFLSPPRLVLSLAVVLVPFLLFGALAAEVTTRSRIGWDASVKQFLSSGSVAGKATPTSHVLTILGDREVIVPVILLVLFGLLVRRAIWQATRFALGTAVAALTPILKDSFDRADTFGPEHSFPSGHALGTMALWASLVVLVWPTRWRVPVAVTCGLVVPLVGLAVVVGGGHLPSDVLAGWLLALGWVGAVTLAFRLVR